VGGKKVDLSLSSVELSKPDWRFPLPGNVGYVSNVSLLKYGGPSDMKLSLLHSIIEPSTEVINKHDHLVDMTLHSLGLRFNCICAE